MKLLNSTSQLVEPLESRKFSRFNLQYTEIEEKPLGEEQWVPRFAGHQSLEERESSFLARDQKINCGFVKGPEGSESTGFDLTEDDASYISRCHIAVISCIFGNSDHLRTPATKTVIGLLCVLVQFVGWRCIRRLRITYEFSSKMFLSSKFHSSKLVLYFLCGIYNLLLFLYESVVHFDHKISQKSI